MCLLGVVALTHYLPWIAAVAKEAHDEVAAVVAKHQIEEAAKAKAEAGRLARLAAPVNVVETLLQGTLKNDEALPPFAYDPAFP